MSDNKFISAKKVMDFYMKKLEGEESQGAQFAQQWANLKMMEYRANCMLDVAYTFDLKVE
jgi:hypothetical protein